MGLQEWAEPGFGLGSELGSGAELSKSTELGSELGTKVGPSDGAEFRS